MVWAGGLPAQVVGPYLQSPTPTSVIVTWKTSVSRESVVRFGTHPDSLNREVTGTCDAMTDAGYAGNYYYHAAQLTGLRPGQFYHYRVISGPDQSTVFRFRSQPETGETAGTYRILVFGDHQLKGSDRYEQLLRAARKKVGELYGGSIEDHINLIINDGDQVDAGTLDQYEHVHFRPSSILSGNIPVMTTMGNHEGYGSMGRNAYYRHFFYEGLNYKGIESPGGENYYAYRQASVLFLHLSSEDPDDDQAGWISRIIEQAAADPEVRWIVAVFHRPVQAEQFVGDISEYMRSRIVPILGRTEKCALLVTGHHHLYARGQVRDLPIYHIISGAASWDQFWGQSYEKDFDDVQKTIDFWAYQIVTFDGSSGRMAVESYAIGSPKLGMAFDNLLIDQFSRNPGIEPPVRPAIETRPDSAVTLPFTFRGSAFESPADEPINSTWFQVAADPAFTELKLDLIRDFENLYGTTGSPDWLPVDIHKGMNIKEFTIGRNRLLNGTYHIRTRYRDRNISWSEWSEPVAFTVTGSQAEFPAIHTGSRVFEPGRPISVQYDNGPGGAKDWIGIYKWGDTPGQTPSTAWSYTTGIEGTVTLTIQNPGRYFIAYFENDGYSEITDRIAIYVSRIPVLTFDKAGYSSGEAVKVSYTNAPAFRNDWIGIYRLDDVPGQGSSQQWAYTDGTAGSVSFTGLADGYYFAVYFFEDAYEEACARQVFSVGNNLAKVQADAEYYHPGETVTVNYEGGPGTLLDWIGMFRSQAPPGTVPLVARQGIGGNRAGSLTFTCPADTGRYYFGLFINNSSVRISNKAEIRVTAASGMVPETGSERIGIYTDPVRHLVRIERPGTLPGRMVVKVWTVGGLLVKELHSGMVPESSLVIDAAGFSRGVYFLEVVTASGRIGRKILLY